MSKEYFDRVASQWDTMREVFFSEAVREKAFAAAGIEPGKVAADIGAGTGFITEGLVKSGLTVIAVDQSEEMLKQMQKNLDYTTAVQYRRGEAEALPIEDGTCDYVFANMFLHHVPAPPAAVKEMVRILKPGGILVVTDLDEHHFEFLREEQFDRWMGFKREDVRRWLSEAGLRKVAVDCLDENCCAQSCKDESASVSIFVATGRKPPL